MLLDYRSAASDMRAARFADAKPRLDAALTTLGGLSAGDKSARKSRGMFRSESSKTFRGEPYERVMAYYYRGLLYWRDGQPMPLGFRDRLHRIVSITHDRDTVTVTAIQVLLPNRPSSYRAIFDADYHIVRTGLNWQF